MNNDILPIITPGEVSLRRTDPLDAATLEETSTILKEVQVRGLDAVRDFAVKFGDRQPEEPLVLTRADINAALHTLPADQQALLQRTADRIRRFAESQRAAIQELDIAVEGGRAGHRLIPVDIAGCYAPGGRFPLPSSVLMTAVTARVAGVPTVWVASPKPSPVTLAAAAVADADALLAVGGAQVIAAMACGVGDIPKCDVIVGPGNRWVTAAKQLVAGRVAIDMIAGPSELVVLADELADARIVALDLLAQAEHDPDALPVLVTPSRSLADNVRELVASFLDEAPTPSAADAVRRGFIVLVKDLDEGAAVCNQLAPEHLELSVAEPDPLVAQLRHYGGLFVGESSAEVFGDYGAGPNHVLPTSGAARHTAGLSVMNFLRLPTWLRMAEGPEMASIAEDAAALARLEGLEWHARAAEIRHKRK